MSSHLRNNIVVHLAISNTKPEQAWREVIELHEAGKTPQRVPKAPQHSTGRYPHAPPNDPLSRQDDSEDVDENNNNNNTNNSPNNNEAAPPQATLPLLPLPLSPAAPPFITQPGNEAGRSADCQPAPKRRAPRARRDHHGKRRPYPLHRSGARVLPYARAAEVPSPSCARRAARVRGAGCVARTGFVARAGMTGTGLGRSARLRGGTL
ncbi:hypothetical protein LTR08_007089 [Meristemomyces frigidus]|nr:hypothetical protein LTR08_007089 [Meristemomyces frigidus]